MLIYNRRLPSPALFFSGCVGENHSLSSRNKARMNVRNIPATLTELSSEKGPQPKEQLSTKSNCAGLVKFTSFRRSLVFQGL
jgi:hypothetical protein